MDRPAVPRYRIVEQIGAGGMGVVYRAEETSLGRQVALKFLPAEFAERPDLLARFEREARAAASLNHPNICTIYGVGSIEPGEEASRGDAAHPFPAGAPFIAMEFIRGRTLRSLVQGRPLPLRDALRISSEVAEGLAHAHQAGVVHRDLKPGNIMITAEGRAKLLDFGLAKLVSEAASAPSLSNASKVDTRSAQVTRHGEVLGTCAYMSPEQTRGLEVDYRSDVFSFGVILYEMLTGRPPFTGPTRSDIMGAVLKDQPASVSRANPEVPPELERILGKCLEKDPGDRYQHTADLAIDLRKLRGTTESASFRMTEPTPARGRRWVLPLGIVAALIGAVVVTATVLRRGPRGSPSSDPIDVALLPFAYEGPADQAYLKNVVPLVLAEGMRAQPRIRIAPSATCRTLSSDEDPRSVAHQLGVAWIISGKLAIKGSKFEAAIRLARGSDASTVWSKESSGEAGSMISIVEPLSREIAATFGADLPGEGARHNPEAMIAYLRGVSLLEGWDIQKNAADAEAAFRKAIEKDDQFEEARAKLAVALIWRFLRTRDASLITEAAAIAARAVELAPSLPEAQEALGMVQLSQGKSVEAAASFERALKSAPGDDALFREIATAYADLARDDEAEQMYRRAVELRPGLWAGYNVWGAFAFRRGKLSKAEQLFRKVIELRPESDAGYGNLAAVLIMSGKHSQAEPILQAALRINPSVQTRNNLGFVYYALGRFEDAAREWGKAAAGTSDAMVFSNLGDAYRQLGQTVEARTAYNRAIEIGKERLAAAPNDVDSRAMMSNALAGTGRCSESAREGARAATDARANPNIAYYAAVASAICHDRSAALNYTLRAIEGGIIADVKTNPDLKFLLSDPAIAAALRKTPLPF